VFGGHVSPGCNVRTTAEIIVANLPGERYTREHDAATGFAELVIRPA
jgi:predicted DNA-binding protein with PD1-like motif